MLKQRRYHLKFFTMQIVITAFSEVNLSRWETYMMCLINTRNKSFLSSFEVTPLAECIAAYPPQQVGFWASPGVCAALIQAASSPVRGLAVAPPAFCASAQTQS